jgi:hypothetical protein
MKIFFEILLLIVAVTILIYLFFYFAHISLAPATQQNLANSVCIKPFGTTQGGENCFQVELAKTEAEKNRGLMNVAKLDKNKGMLFIFDKEGIYPFWMKNTLIPLDIIWIDNNYKVVFISPNAQPCLNLICPSIIPPAKAMFVLEINAGIVEQINLKIGDEIKMNIDLKK